MNRVILCGRLSARPRVAFTPCGVAVVHLLLQVPWRHGTRTQEVVADEISCFAFREVASELDAWGDAGRRLSLEGRLLTGVFLDGQGNPLRGSHVWVESACFLDPLPDQTIFHTASREKEPKEASHGREAA